MRRLAAILILLGGCSAFQTEPVASLRGRLVLDVEPNPLVAVPAGEDWYELRFDIVMREEGGVAVLIEDFTVDAIAFRTVTVSSQTFPGTYITQRGYPARVEAGQYLRFSFVRRWHLPTRLLLSGASARITARTIDERGARGETSLRVGITVGGLIAPEQPSREGSDPK